MPNLSVASIAAACDIGFPVSIRQDFLGGQLGALKDPLAARQAECQPWEVIGDAEIRAIHAGLMHTGEIMYFGGNSDTQGAYVFDTRSETVTSMPAVAQNPGTDDEPLPLTNMFCAGHAFLADGKLLVAGGHLPNLGEGEGIDQEATDAALENNPDANPVLLHDHPIGMGGGGDNACYTFEPVRREWVRVDDLNPSPDKLNPGSENAENSGGRWYPTLSTLFDNQVICVAGHPNRREDYAPTGEGRRHTNNTPERYAPWADTWTLLLAETTAEGPSVFHLYPRQFLTKGGQIFFATQIKEANRFFDPYAGTFFDASIGLPGESIYHEGSRASAVLLPLLPENGYQSRVMISGGVTPFVIDLGTDHEDWESGGWSPPSWQQAGERTGWDNDGPPERSHACTILLPDGTVFVSGGTRTENSDDEIRQSGGVRHGEIYDPDINWDSGEFGSNGNWSRVAAAHVVRHYHSTALLMPNGTVWTAGSNGDETGPEHRIEVYRPPYCAMTGRPSVTESPAALIFMAQFELRCPQAGAIRRVALIRNGSVTHAFDGDQRYVGLEFEHAGGDRLIVTAPPHSAIAPPGYYTIWVIDDERRPCLWAPMVKVGAMSVRRTVAECGVGPPLSLRNDVFGIGGNTVPSLRHQINDVQRTCIF